MVEETKRPLRRRRFGCILERKGSTGDVTSIEARYISPINGQRVSKRFAPGRRGDAEDWLETERSIVDLHRRGMMTWIPPRDRDGNTLTPKLTFGVFADGYVRRHRRKDGAEIAGSTLRNLRNDIKHLKEAFGDVKLAELTEELVTEWYYGPHPNGEWQFRSECIRLKMLLREACAPSSKGAPPLLAENPFTLPIPPEPEAGSSDIPPVTPDELYHIYNAMPGYTRLSVYLAACAGGMRIGEVCGLMDTDFDLENKVLMIRRSVSHGADDLGPSRIGRLKTKGSRRTVPIPDMLIPLIRMHLEDRPDQSNHMFFQAKRGEILCQNTLRNHFMKARKAAGRPDLQFRTLRVTHATRLMLDGSSLKETMDALGHVREETTLRHYLRAVPEHQREAAERTAAYLLSADPSLAIASLPSRSRRAGRGRRCGRHSRAGVAAWPGVDADGRHRRPERAAGRIARLPPAPAVTRLWPDRPCPHPARVRDGPAFPWASRRAVRRGRGTCSRRAIARSAPRRVRDRSRGPSPAPGGCIRSHSPGTCSRGWRPGGPDRGRRRRCGPCRR